MAQEKFVEFYSQYLPKHDEVRKKLDECRQQDDFVRVAVEEGTKAGFQFTKDDVKEVMDASTGKSSKGLKVNVQAVTSSVVGHDVSPDQLAQVAGGQRNVYAGCCW